MAPDLVVVSLRALCRRNTARAFPHLQLFPLDPLCRLIAAALMQDQLGCAAVGVGNERDLSIKNLKKVISLSFWKDLELWLPRRLCEEVIAFARDHGVSRSIAHGRQPGAVAAHVRGGLPHGGAAGGIQGH